MTLTLYLHPLSSFCHKVLIALYENETPFEPVTIDFGDSDSKGQLLSRWPVGKIPVLHDSVSGLDIPETSIIIEYLQLHYPGPAQLLPSEPKAALQTGFWDRFFDLYIHVPMQRIVAERLRPTDSLDPQGVAEALAALDKAYAILERHMERGQWAGADHFSMADCAASPALFYASILHPFGNDMPNTLAYFERLMDRPSIKRTIDEARPYFQYFPYKESMPPRFLQG